MQTSKTAKVIYKYTYRFCIKFIIDVTWNYSF